MKSIDYFPDIYTCVLIPDDHLSIDIIREVYKFYILECDIYIPKIYFIPLPNKKDESARQGGGLDSGCFYNYGHI